MRLALILALTLPALAEAQAPPPPSPPKAQVVKLSAGKGIELEADYYPRAKAKAGVVLLHMLEGDRSAYKPLVPSLHAAGFAVLALDMRGHGGSKTQKGKDWSKRVKKGDKGLFRKMHEDARAGVEYLVKTLKVGEAKVGVVGASVGANVAFDYARRNPKCPLVVGLSPGKNYMGLNAVSHAKKCKDRAVLVVSSKEQAPSGAALIQKALKKNPRLEVQIYDKPEVEIHGTMIFGKIHGIETRISAWLAKQLSP